MSVVDVTTRIDRFQRRHAWIAFPLAVRRKYAEDRGGSVAAMITFYTFFSLFPLLIVGATLVGFVVQEDPALQERLARSVLGQIPLIGSDLRVNALTGSPAALVLGLATSLWAGMKVFVAAESAARWIWYERDRRVTGFFRARLRAFELLVIIGGGALVTTALAAARAASNEGRPASEALVLLSLAADFGLFWIASRLLAPPDVHWRQLAFGAAVGAGAWAILQQVGDMFVSHVLTTASATYGTFAAVIGLLSFIYLAVMAALVATEINVVAARGLWPRSVAPFERSSPTLGDERATARRIEALAGDWTGVESRKQVGSVADSTKTTRRAAVTHIR